MSEPLHPEDRTILALLEALETDAGADALLDAAAPRGDEGETLARLYTEVVGLIPYALEPAAPQPGLRQRVLALATGDETQDLMPAPAAAAPARPRMITPPSLSQATQTPPAAAAEPVRPRRARASRWPLALAASLALALLGVTLWLYSGIRQQDATIDRLARELRTTEERAEQLARGQQEAQAQLAELRGNFGLVTSPAVEISPLRPAEQSPQPQARGFLWVASDHQHWYLSVHDLKPLGDGRQYQLWFLSDDAAVSGGTFDARPGSPVNLSSEHMPPGTKAVVITMEPGVGAPAPSGPEVLRAAGKFQLL